MKTKNVVIVALLILGVLATYLSIACWWNVQPKEEIHLIPWVPQNCEFHPAGSVEIGTRSILLSVDELKLITKEEDKIVVVYADGNGSRGRVNYWKPSANGIFYCAEAYMPEAHNAWATESKIKFDKVSKSFTYTPIKKSYNMFYLIVFFWGVGGFTLALIWAKNN